MLSPVPVPTGEDWGRLALTWSSQETIQLIIQMKASQLIKKLCHTLLGKKSNNPTAGDVATVTQLASDTKAPEVVFRVHDGLGVIQLHENWRN
jgi:hypothetical protein